MRFKLVSSAVRQCKALAFLVVVSGCATSDKAYMYNAEDNQKECHGSCISAEKYMLGFVEFDDDGYYHYPKQKEEVLRWIRKQANSNKDGETAGVIIVSFTHGWYNNATAGNGNRAEFISVLEGLYDSEKELTDAINVSRQARGETKVLPRKVIGIYTGWRGLSVTTPLVRGLSFWERKNVAQLIGQRDGKDYFSSLDAMKKSIADSDSRLIIVGHSFGGLLVHSATTGLMVDRFNQAKYDDHDGGLYRGVGDLVVLINPAFEALDIAYLLTASSRKENTSHENEGENTNYSLAQRPFFTILASEADRATNVPFKIGRFFTTFFDKYTNKLNVDDSWFVDRRAADNTAIGHYEQLRTHTLTLEEKGSFVASSATDIDAPKFDVICRALQQWQQDDPNALFYSNDKVFNLEQKPHALRKSLQKQNPYMLVSVSKKILPGHGISGTEDLRSFVGALVAFSSTPDGIMRECSVAALLEMQDGVGKSHGDNLE